MSLCQYKGIFGNPNEGAHSYRFFGIAFIDLFLTILIAYFYSNYYETNFWSTFLILMLIAVVVHRIFCVNTTINTMIFGQVYS